MSRDVICFIGYGKSPKGDLSFYRMPMILKMKKMRIYDKSHAIIFRHD
jgi:hypothetical protein